MRIAPGKLYTSEKIATQKTDAERQSGFTKELHRRHSVCAFDLLSLTLPIPTFLGNKRKEALLSFSAIHHLCFGAVTRIYHRCI